MKPDGIWAMTDVSGGQSLKFLANPGSEDLTRTWRLYSNRMRTRSLGRAFRGWIPFSRILSTESGTGFTEARRRAGPNHRKHQDQPRPHGGLFPLVASWKLALVRRGFTDREFRVKVKWWRIPSWTRKISISAYAAPLCEWRETSCRRLPSSMLLTASGDSFHKRPSADSASGTSHGIIGPDFPRTKGPSVSVRIRSLGMAATNFCPF